MISPDTPIHTIPKISKRVLPALHRLGISTIRDLLFHFPSRYENFLNIKKISDAAVGEVVTISGQIERITSRRTPRKRLTITEAIIRDETGTMNAVWFNQPFLARTMRAGNSVSLSGKVVIGVWGKHLQSPAYEKRINTDRLHTGGLIPTYPETRGITSRWIRFLIQSFLQVSRILEDPLPAETRARHKLPQISEALRSIHFPKTEANAARARRRFDFETLLMIQLRSLRERMHLAKEHAPIIPTDVPLIKQFVQSLPFPLTDSQRRSMWEIFRDMAKPKPMNRLLEGDVGSGKTLVAASAALLAARSGYKTLFMAPTEILARQHYHTLSGRLAPFHVSVGLMVAKEKKAVLQAHIVVGTHALIQDNAQFDALGLVVVDEQHRFGVNQRAALVRQRQNNLPLLLPHFLSMSATPIPRTLALTIYGDLDLSILDQMPQSRKPVITRIVAPAERSDAYRFIESEVRRGRQVFVICPRIEKKEETQTQASPLSPRQLFALELKSVKEEYKKLSEKIFPALRVGMLHGKVPHTGKESKEKIMKRFHEGAIDVLVATSVVEVGIDVPNATVMMIEGAERFGLAQLHQFRGRVGRGADQSYCFLFPSDESPVTRRLRAVVEAKNGFELAEKDLEIRGPGDLFGSQQWGASNSVIQAMTDASLVRDIRKEALELLKNDNELGRYSALKKALDAVEEKIHME